MFCRNTGSIIYDFSTVLCCNGTVKHSTFNVEYFSIISTFSSFLFLLLILISDRHKHTLKPCNTLCHDHTYLIIVKTPLGYSVLQAPHAWDHECSKKKMISMFDCARSGWSPSFVIINILFLNKNFSITLISPSVGGSSHLTGSWPIAVSWAKDQSESFQCCSTEREQTQQQVRPMSERHEQYEWQCL